MKTGFVAMVGLTNAGKSTLVNALVGQKVGIVSSKPQTTRKRVMGILNEQDAQVVFVDAPGQVRDPKGLNAFLATEFLAAIDESDMVLAVLNVDAKKPEHLEKLLQLVRDSTKPWMAVITKDDLPHPQRTVKVRQMVDAYGGQCVAISALKRPEEMRELLLPLILKMLPESEVPMYPTDLFTTQSEKEILAEIVREKCFQRLHQEIPFGLTTRVMQFQETAKGIICDIDIVVSKASHVSIVIGQGGQNLKTIGMESRMEAEQILGRKVTIKTFVKCDEDWTNRPVKMQEFGYAQRS